MIYILYLILQFIRYTQFYYLYDILCIILKIIYFNKANEYYSKVRSNDSKLFKIQNEFIQLLSKIDYKEIYPCGSFSCLLNILDRSDIDIGLLLENNDNNNEISNSLMKLGFKYKGKCEYNNTNKELEYDSYVIYKNNIEIEIKVRLITPYKKYMMPIIEYYKNLSNNDKVIFTYIKYLLKDNIEYYSLNKKIFYNYVCYKINSNSYVKI